MSCRFKKKVRYRLVLLFDLNDFDLEFEETDTEDNLLLLRFITIVLIGVDIVLKQQNIARHFMF